MKFLATLAISSPKSIPYISLRGIIISSTVAFSKSTILSYICKCGFVIFKEDSFKTVLSSSDDNELFDILSFRPSILIILLAIKFIQKTNGYNIINMGLYSSEDEYAIFSECISPIVFGVNSAKINIKIVKNPVAMANPISP